MNACNYCGEQHDDVTRAQCDTRRLEAERVEQWMADDERPAEPLHGWLEHCRELHHDTRLDAEREHGSES